MLDCWKKIKESSILVTGGTGFVSYYVVNALLFMNDVLGFKNQVVVHARNFSKLKSMYGNLLLRDDFSVVIGDITRGLSIPDKIDYIIHTAMPSDSKYLKEHSREAFDAAVEGTRNVIEIAKKFSAKSIVFMSSVTIYGELRKLEIAEDYYDAQDWRSANDAYMMGKRSAEFLLLSAFHNDGLPVKILRPGFIFGANPNEDRRVYNSFIDRAARGQDLIINSDGTLTRSLVYVVDVIRAIFMALASDSNGEAFNISCKNVSLWDFTQKLGRVAGVRYSRKIEPGSDKAVECSNILIDHAFDDLGWKPSCLEDSIQEAIYIKRMLISIT